MYGAHRRASTRKITYSSYSDTMKRTLNMYDAKDESTFKRLWRSHLRQMAKTGDVETREAMFDGDIDVIAGEVIDDDHNTYYNANMDVVQVRAEDFDRAAEIIRDEAREAVHCYYEDLGEGSEIVVVQVDGLDHESRYPQIFVEATFSPSQEEQAQDYMHIMGSGRDCVLTLAKLQADGTFVDLFEDPKVTYEL